MYSKKTLIFVVVLLTIASNVNAQLFIKKKEFTIDSKTEIDFRGIPMNAILLYVSGEIQIKRLINEKDDAGAKQKYGNVVFENGKAYAYKKFTSSATGKSDTMINNRTEVRFENEPGAYFTFAKKKGKYDTVEKYYIVLNKGRKTVSYAGATWDVLYGKDTYLFWKPKEKTKNKKTKDKVRGLKNDGTEKKTLKDRFKGK